MRAARSNLQRQNTMYSHKKCAILQHLLLMRLTVDTTWAEGAGATSFSRNVDSSNRRFAETSYRRISINRIVILPNSKIAETV